MIDMAKATEVAKQFLGFYFPKFDQGKMARRELGCVYVTFIL